jgi:hypothetical protein
VTNPPELEEALNRTQHWYEQTKNPLYVWEAITRCLHADEPPSLPGWCLGYLRDTAKNLHSLACGVDFRERQEAGSAIKKISSDQAFKLTSNALSLARQGKKNAFASLRVDRDDTRAWLDDHYYGRDAGAPEIQMLRNLTPESARRRIARGKRLNDVKRKSSACKLHIIAGAPGGGKTTIYLYIFPSRPSFHPAKHGRTERARPLEMY